MLKKVIVQNSGIGENKLDGSKFYFVIVSPKDNPDSAFRAFITASEKYNKGDEVWVESYKNKKGYWTSKVVPL